MAEDELQVDRRLEDHMHIRGSSGPHDTTMMLFADVDADMEGRRPVVERWMLDVGRGNVAFTEALNAEAEGIAAFACPKTCGNL
jgi:hypothetical protein